MRYFRVSFSHMYLAPSRMNQGFPSFLPSFLHIFERDRVMSSIVICPRDLSEVVDEAGAKEIVRKGRSSFTPTLLHMWPKQHAFSFSLPSSFTLFPAIPNWNSVISFSFKNLTF